MSDDAVTAAPAPGAPSSWGFPPADWKVRRRVLIAAVAFCGGALAWILWRGGDTQLSQNGLYVFSMAAVTLIGQYVFGAAWDDHNFRRAVVAIRTNSNG